MENFIKLDIKDDIAVISLINPKKMNAINADTLNQLEKQLNKVSEKKIKCLYITGSDGVFSAGGDLNYMSEMDKKEAESASLYIQKIMSKIESLPFLTIALVQGAAFGGGLELALACDICVAEQDSTFALPELRFGIIPAGGGTVRALEKINYSGMMYYLFSSDSISAKSALQDKLIQKIIDKDTSEDFIHFFNKKLEIISFEAIKKIKYHLKENQNNLIDNQRDKCFKREASLFSELLVNGGGKKMKDFLNQNKKSND